MKIILLSLLISTSVFANEPPKVEPKQEVAAEQSNKKRCKFSDLACQNRNDRPVTRKLKRLSRF